ITQDPIDGVSMLPSFNDAKAPEFHETQYFEIMGNRAIYSDGWVAACFHGRTPWQTGTNPDFQDDVWELYDTSQDWSEANDLATSNPDKLRELQDLFLMEAARHQVFPLDDRGVQRAADASLRPSFFTGRDLITLYSGMTRLPEGSAPKFSSVHHTITVKATIPEGGADGVLVALGGDSAGFTLYVKDQRLHYEYNWFNFERYKVSSSDPVPAGEVTMGFDFVPESPAPGSPADVTLSINGAAVGSGKIEQQVPARFSTESLDIGQDCMSPVSDDYGQTRFFPFTGAIETVQIAFPKGQASLTPEDRYRIAIGLA
ncbi:MAG: arylsulfatase, partial [Thermomicrobiales bacterium]